MRPNRSSISSQKCPARTLFNLVACLLTVLLLAACQGQDPTAAITPVGNEIAPARTEAAPATTIPSPSPQPASIIISPATPLSNLPVYLAQSGETVRTVATHFGLNPSDITSPEEIPGERLLRPGQPLYLPARLANAVNTTQILPDSEVVYSPSAADFSIDAYLQKTNGYLSTHREYLKSTGWTSAADIITRLARDTSINPRLLLALLENKCHCVLGQLDKSIQPDFLLGNTDYRAKGLYLQLSWATDRLSSGYYGWRSGVLNQIQFPDKTVIQPVPASNAGSVALEYFYAFYGGGEEWQKSLDSTQGLPALLSSMFGDPWERARTVEPLLPAGLIQPALRLPFEPGRMWSYTSGPHYFWEDGGVLAALDFAPAAAESGCMPSDAWVTAMADGIITRSEIGTVVLDLNEPGKTASDGLDQTGWAITYMHIDPNGSVPVGAVLHTGDRIGHPSCAGGHATGTHIHVARKYNGEWIAADGPLPFVMSGWTAHAGSYPYQGTLTNNGQTVIAHPFGSFETHIFLPTATPSVTITATP